MIKFIKAYLKKRHYKKYMQSIEWKNMRAMVLKRDGRQCFLCGEKQGLEVHHLIYEKNLYDTKMYQCITLCKKHHFQIHRKLQMI